MFLIAETSGEAELRSRNGKIERMVIKITMCESSGRHDGVWGKAGEYGIAQFKYKTFEWLKIKAGHPEYRWEDREDQLNLLRWALAHNLKSHWTCAR